MKRQLLSLLSIALFILSLVAPMSARKVAAGGDTQQTAPVNTTPDAFTLGPAVPGAYATLIRNKNGITTSVHTTETDAGVYSLWWVIFNHPENCNDPNDEYQCEYDLPDIIVNAIAHVSAGGNLNLSANLDVGGPYSGEVICPGIAGPCSGDGLTNPSGALVLLVLRYHGPATPGIVQNQLTEYLAGPDDCAICVDNQLVLFLP
jgi:hypothetical protein